MRTLLDHLNEDFDTVVPAPATSAPCTSPNRTCYEHLVAPDPFALLVCRTNSHRAILPQEPRARRAARRTERTARRQQKSDALREREQADGRLTWWEHLMRDDGL
jgi:hypothetical protein